MGDDGGPLTILQALGDVGVAALEKLGERWQDRGRYRLAWR